LNFPATDGDYNDAVVKIETVPEPSSLLVLASSSMGALGYLIRRRRNG
ncbi:MAG: PEP-CTERM sorting domain-containing protein, partial [Armatimonadetes bacterium]|nr:PEP-CTERM sorting domain-containing protein [Armatimonadota bacterium]